MTYRVLPFWPVVCSAVAVPLFLVGFVALLRCDRGWVRGVLGFLLVMGILFPLAAFAVGSIFGKLTALDGVVAVRTTYKTRRFERGQATATASVNQLVGNPIRTELLTFTRTTDGQKAVFFIGWMSRRRRDELLATVAETLDTRIKGLETLRRSPSQ